VVVGRVAHQVALAISLLLVGSLRRLTVNGRPPS
jgi:hypothetical protein